MFKKLLLFLICILICFFNSYAVDLTDCQTIAAGGYFRLMNDVNVSGASCFTINADHVYLDLNGFDIFGDGTGSGINIIRTSENFTVENGNVYNLSNGVYFSNCCDTNDFVYTLYNINFYDNNNDMYIDSWQTSRIFQLINSTFENRMYLIL